MSKSLKRTAKLSKREQEQASCQLFFLWCPLDVRAYTATISYRRSAQSGIIKNHILVS